MKVLPAEASDHFTPTSSHWEQSRSRLPAVLCAFALFLCALVCHATCDIGISDDWSYIKSAQLLAKTGHVVYNGWATAMLGWQLFLGALFAKLFGPSFTAIRASTLLVSALTAFFSQRTMIRAGIDSRNATIGTLTLVLSPLFLPLAFTFMTDIGGLFSIVLCLYACLRALQAGSEKSELAWLAFAAASNTFLGNVRQIAWLGALVMVPCTVWLLRRRPRVVWASILFCSFSAVGIFCTLRWFSRQPYSIPESLLPDPLNGQIVYLIGLHLCTFFLGLSMFLLPLLTAFVKSISFSEKRNRVLLKRGARFAVVAGLLLCIVDRSSVIGLVAPYSGDWVTLHGLVDGAPIQGSRPVVLTPLLRTILTIAVIFGLNCFSTFLLNKPQIIGFEEKPSRISWNDLLILVGPFILGYVAVLVPRASDGYLFDRYLLPLLFVGSILLLRLFQDRVQPELPSMSIVIALLFAAYAVAGTHDAFALYRAKAAAIAELHKAGIPDTSIDGGFEHNGMTQIERFGYMNDPRTRVPTRVFVPFKSPFPSDCEPYLELLTPAIVPGYSLSFSANACGGPSSFAPVDYYDWLGFQTHKVYIVRTRKAIPNAG